MPRPQMSDTATPDEPMAVRWILLLLRLTQIILVAWIAMVLPMPAIEQWLPLKGPLVSLAAVILIGKAIYDTLFYERYRL